MTELNCYNSFFSPHMTKAPRWNEALRHSRSTGPVRDALKSIPDLRRLLSLRPFLPKGHTPLKHAPKPIVGTPGPRNDFGPREVLAIAAALQARDRARLTRLTAAGRLRKWGNL